MKAVLQSDAYSRSDILRILKINELSLRAWERHGIYPERDEFRFGELGELRTLKRLRDERIGPARIRQSLEALRERTGVERPLLELRIQSQGRRITVDLAAGKMEALTGQFLLPFEPVRLERVQTLQPAPQVRDPEKLRQAEHWFQQGLDFEERGGASGEAKAAYERAVDLNPEAAGAWVNLGTLHYRGGEVKAAERYYRRALDVSPDYALAHFNLGNVCEELGRLKEAAECYERSIELHPGYADAHYNLALVYERTGEPMRAAKHWRDYLRLDPASPWAGIARQQLQGLLEVTQGGGGLRGENRGLGPH